MDYRVFRPPESLVPSIPGAHINASHSMVKYEGFHSHGGTPKNGWFIMDDPNLKWMIWRYTLEETLILYCDASGFSSPQGPNWGELFGRRWATRVVVNLGVGTTHQIPNFPTNCVLIHQ